MRIQRSQSRLTFRRRRQTGCLSFIVVFVVIGSIGSGVYTWLSRWRPPEEPIAGMNTDVLRSAYNAFERGDLSGTISITRQILSEQPAQPDAVLLLTRALIYRSYAEYDRAIDRQLALEVTTEAQRVEPLNPHIRAAHAFALVAMDNPAAAADVARQVLDQQPENAIARTALALAYGSVGSFEVALRESTRALDSAAGWMRMDALRAQAISQSDLGAYEEAVRAVEAAISVNPNLVLLYFERAQYALLLGAAAAVRTLQLDARTRDGAALLWGSHAARPRLVGRLVSARHGVFLAGAV
jgi:tetratricopeptide (TPR) repeat protein